MACCLYLMTFCMVLMMGSLGEAKPAVGVVPELTIDKYKAIWLDEEQIAKAKECVFKRINCTPIMQNLIDLFPEVYKTACANCDERERIIYRTGGRNAYQQEREFFNRIIAKFDKENIYLDAFLKFILEED